MIHKEQGYTLVEWLISLALGLFLVASSTKLYLHLSKAFLLIGSEQRLHIEACTAFSFLAYDIRMAGFIGCPNSEEIGAYEKHNEGIIGWQKNSTYLSELDPAIQKSLERSDVICLQYADPDRIPVLRAEKSTVQLASPVTFSAQDVLLISDCRHAEIVKWASVQLQHTYSRDATISHLHRILYYVSPVRHSRERQSTCYALHRKDLYAKDCPTAVVDHIEKIEVYYGVPTTHTTLQYLSANQVRDWGQIQSVTVVLHLASPNETRKSQTRPHTQTKLHTTSQTITIRSRESLYRRW